MTVQGVPGPRRRFTADEVLRMLEVGLLHEDDPVELLDGELIVVSPQGTRHRAWSVRLHQLLEAAFGAGFHVQDHSPIDGGAHSMPEPDVAVVRGPVEAYLDRHPGGADLALVVEISVTTVAYDRAKGAVYARAAVPEYWQLDLPARRLVVSQEPRPEHGEYALVRTLHPGDAVGVAGGTLRVSDLFPPAT